eukprot:CAMPEP_0174347130 /NCGR_PEP_ID=MMETSP0811_2-20130205/3073_1 /TAXON_ID=73025 ORGANISM="Eutreptiella gymnastica-like, Strain CCMP1594" /NCGR_SAMPLE_ID=MMETSP0811_2 /ASSEMBLY_ACC=CAM_ASM_000667 /LENGTH=187 /DNA_ID=CAMNT_0015472339 /DNA_START=71 /DNA_END=633 /DNA_ORIENTATION=+
MTLDIGVAQVPKQIPSLDTTTTQHCSSPAPATHAYASMLPLAEHHACVGKSATLHPQASPLGLKSLRRVCSFLFLRTPLPMTADMGDSPCVLAHRALIEVEKERLLRSRVAETHSMDTAMGQAVPEGVCGERLCFPSLRDNTTGQTNPKAGGVQGPPMGCGAVHLAVTSKWQAYLLAHRHSGWHGYC